MTKKFYSNDLSTYQKPTDYRQKETSILTSAINILACGVGAIGPKGLLALTTPMKCQPVYGDTIKAP